MMNDPYFSNSKFFAQLTSKQRERLKRELVQIEAARGTYVYCKNSPRDRIYFLAKGTILVGTKYEDREEVLPKYMVKPGDIFGEKSLWPQWHPREFAVVKSESTSYFRLHIDTLKCFLRENQSFRYDFSMALFERINRVEDHCTLLNHKDTCQRLKKLILSFVPVTAKCSQTSIKIEHHLSLKEMGQMVRATPQTMSSILNEWRQKKILDYSKNTLLIYDFQRFIHGGN